MLGTPFLALLHNMTGDILPGLNRRHIKRHINFFQIRLHDLQRPEFEIHPRRTRKMRLIILRTHNKHTHQRHTAFPRLLARETQSRVIVRPQISLEPVHHTVSHFDLLPLRFCFLDSRLEDCHWPGYLIVVVAFAALVAHFWGVEFALDDAVAFFDAAVAEGGFMFFGRRGADGRGCFALWRHVEGCRCRQTTNTNYRSSRDDSG